MRTRSIGALCALSAALYLVTAPASASPLDTGSWLQIARMSNSDVGMFDGNGAFDPAYTFGTYSSPLQADDFHRPFSTYAGMSILFITGDQTIWGQTSYATLKGLIDAQSGHFQPNITFNAHFGGTDQIVMGNVLSRGPGAPEDPWISLVGDHFQGIASAMILWGESDYTAQHADLKNTHNGVNVYVSQLVAPVPLPGALPLFASVLGLLGIARWRRKFAMLRGRILGRASLAAVG